MSLRMGDMSGISSSPDPGILFVHKRIIRVLNILYSISLLLPLPGKGIKMEFVSARAKTKGLTMTNKAMLISARIIYFMCLLFSAVCSYASLNSGVSELLNFAAAAYPYMTGFMPITLIAAGIFGVFLYIGINEEKNRNYDGFLIVITGVTLYIMGGIGREALPYAYFAVFVIYI